MKTVLTSTLALVLALPALGALQWQTDLEAAKKQAAEEKKDLLLDFTGSDWCGWCKRLKAEVFNKEDFQKGTTGSFVFVEVDFPRDKSKLTPALMKQNAELKEAFGIRGYPSIVLCDADGRPYASTGYRQGGAEPYLEHLNELRQKRTERDEALAAAAKAEGKKKAEHLEAALRSVPATTLNGAYGKEMEALAKLDSENSLVVAQRQARRVQGYQTQFRELFVGRNYKGAVTHADKILKDDKPEGEIRQQILYYKFSALIAQKKHDDAKGTAKELIELGPKTRVGQSVQRFLDQLKAKEEAAKEEKKSTSFVPADDFWLINQPAASAKPAAPNEKKLKEEISKLKAQLQATTVRIDEDHKKWEALEKEMAASDQRMEVLKVQLAKEQAKFNEMKTAEAALEKRHDGDHKREVQLKMALAEAEKALKTAATRDEEIKKLEQQAETLRKQAEELRKKADELRKKK